MNAYNRYCEVAARINRLIDSGHKWGDQIIMQLNWLAQMAWKEYRRYLNVRHANAVARVRTRLERTNG